MFQIVCALALEVLGVLLELRCLNGVSPNVVLACEPWGHVDHCNEGVSASLPIALEPMFMTSRLLHTMSCLSQGSCRMRFLRP